MDPPHPIPSLASITSLNNWLSLRLLVCIAENWIEEEITEACTIPIIATVESVPKPVKVHVFSNLIEALSTLDKIAHLPLYLCQRCTELVDVLPIAKHRTMPRHQRLVFERLKCRKHFDPFSWK